MSPDHCTCETGRSNDGSEHGPCAYCEEQAWREEEEAWRTDNGMRDEDLEEMIREPLT